MIKAVPKAYGKSKPGKIQTSIFIPKKISHYIYCVTSNECNTKCSFTFFVYIFEKRNIEVLNPDAPIPPSHQSCLTSELQGYIYRGTSTGRSHTPSKIPASVNRSPRGYTKAR